MKINQIIDEKKSKPDFLDMDKDGNKKEPMKKAIADKKKKGPVKESEEDLEYAKKYLRYLQRMDASTARIYKQKKKIADLEKKKEPVKEVSDQERLSARKVQRDAQTARHGTERKPGESMAAYLARADKLKKKKGPVKESSSIDNTIKMIFGKIYDYGDAGLDYLDNNAPLYDKLANQFDGDLDAILANTPDQVKMNLAKEMKSVLDSIKFEMESVTTEISSKTRQAYNKAAQAGLDKAQASGDKKTFKKRDRGLDLAYDAKIRDMKKSRLARTPEAEFKAPTHELNDTARQAMNIAQMIKRKINSGEQMDDRDYNQMAELGAILSRFGTNFGPQSMNDVLKHMVQFTNDRNEYGHGYPEFNVERFKELIAMAK